MFSADVEVQGGDGFFFGETTNAKGIDGNQEALNAIDQAAQMARQLLVLGVFGSDAATKTWTVSVSGHFKSQGNGKEFITFKVSEA